MIPRILDAAERLFAQSGTTSVSIRDIAAEARLPHSAIYRYFHSKEDVLREVLLRGRARQIERDARSRMAGRTLDDAVEWLMTTNRAYMLAIARAAMEGETPSSLGLDPSEGPAAQSLRILERGEYPFGVRSSHDPRIIIAALMALSIGWAVAEKWVVDSLALQDRDIAVVRREIGQIMGSLMTLGAGPETSSGLQGPDLSNPADGLHSA